MVDKKFKIFYDAEFTGLHKNTSLISIGMVAETGSYFYGEFSDYDQAQVDDWLQDNVINNLMFNDKKFYLSPLRPVRKEENGPTIFSTIVKGNRNEIKERLLSWLINGSGFNADSEGNQIQFYTDCYAYDWVLLNDLICDHGLALNLPDYIYYIPMDLSTALQLKGYNPDITREEFAGQYAVDILGRWPVFKDLGEKCKHNSLWDAAICSWCFHALINSGINKDVTRPIPMPN